MGQEAGRRINGWADQLRGDDSSGKSFVTAMYKELGNDRQILKPCC
jgi:hypothetical protein